MRLIELEGGWIKIEPFDQDSTAISCTNTADDVLMLRPYPSNKKHDGVSSSKLTVQFAKWTASSGNYFVYLEALLLPRPNEFVIHVCRNTLMSDYSDAVLVTAIRDASFSLAQETKIGTTGELWFWKLKTHPVDFKLIMFVFAARGITRLCLSDFTKLTDEGIRTRFKGL